MENVLFISGILKTSYKNLAEMIYLIENSLGHLHNYLSERATDSIFRNPRG